MKTKIACLTAVALISIVTWSAADRQASNRLSQCLDRAEGHGLVLSLRQLGVSEPMNRATTDLLSAATRIGELAEAGEIDWSVPLADDARAAFEPEVHKLRAALATGDCRIPPRADDSIDVGGLVATANLLRSLAHDACLEGELDDALSHLRTLLDIDTAIGDCPMLIAQMVRLVVVGHSLDVAAAMLEGGADPGTLDAAVASLSPGGAIASGLRGEIAFFADAFGPRMTGAIDPLHFDRTVAFGEDPRGTWGGRMVWHLGRPYFEGELADTMQFALRQWDAVHLDYPQGLAQVDDGRPSSRWQSSFALPKLGSLLRQEAKMASRVAMLRAGCAMATGSADPETIDPITGRPFVIDTDDDGRARISSEDAEVPPLTLPR